jgi:hypothetical protein
MKRQGSQKSSDLKWGQVYWTLTHLVYQVNWVLIQLSNTVLEESESKNEILVSLTNTKIHNTE